MSQEYAVVQSCMAEQKLESQPVRFMFRRNSPLSRLMCSLPSAAFWAALSAPSTCLVAPRNGG